MRNRFLFRSHGNVVRTHSLMREALTVAVALLAALLLLAWGHQADATVRDQRAYESGHLAGQLYMQQSVGDAYRQGRIDAQAELGERLGAGCAVPPTTAQPAQSGRP